MSPRLPRPAAWLAHPAGPALLVLAALAEGTVFPAPTEAIFLALALARPESLGRLTGLAALASVAGGGLGYLLGATLFETVGRPVLEWSGGAARLDAVAALYRDNLAAALLTSGYTPIPYLVYAQAAGAFHVPLLPFLLFSLLGRGAKYLILALLARLAGPAVYRLTRRYGAWAVAAVTAGLLALWWLRRG